MKIDLYKTLEELDNDIWTAPAGEFSFLVLTIHRLRKKPLKDFTIEDLRIAIGQNLNLIHLIPIAIKELRQNILAEGDFYEGDLLKSVLTSDINFWQTNKHYWNIIKDLFEENRAMLESHNSHKQIVKSFDRFEQINK